MTLPLRPLGLALLAYAIIWVLNRTLGVPPVVAVLVTGVGFGVASAVRERTRP